MVSYRGRDDSESATLSRSSNRETTREFARTILLVATFAYAGIVSCAAAPTAGVGPWITTWAATPAPRWGEELPAPFGVLDVLGDQTVRQIVRISVGGDQVRVMISNEFGSKPLTVGSATVALSVGGSAVDPASVRVLSFGGRSWAVIPPGAPLISDPVHLAVKPLASLAVSLYLPQKSAVASVHWDGRQTGFISGSGDATRAANFTAVSTTQSRLFLSGILTNARAVSTAIVFFGDSITDGACSSLDANHRWPDHIAERMQAEGHPDVAIVNEAYSGNRVLSNGMGTNALSRFDMSVLAHPRVSAVVMMMGINDIGWPGEAAITPNDPEPTAEDLEVGYAQLVDRAHAHGLRFIAVTLSPFADALKGSPASGYYTPAKEKIRENVNRWIRGNRAIDGVIDFDKLLADPKDPIKLNPAYNCGDNLHPNDAGYQAMAKAVDLNMLLKKE
jgi:lysophospholipase L1-like esterase